MTPSPPTTPEAVLLAAADYIEQHGWCKGMYSTANGQVCALGALRAVVFGDPEICRADKWGLVHEAEQRLPAPVALWNDAQPDASTVVAALRRAAGGQI